MTAHLHQRLRDAAASMTGEPVRLSRLAELHGSAMTGSMLVLMATPCVLPVPGIGNVMGLALMLMAVPLWRGEDCPLLPRRVADVELSGRWARRVLATLAHFYGYAGRWSAERLPRLAVLKPRSWIAAKVALMGGIIFLPIPLGNVLPAAALVLLGLGLAFRDGVAVLLSAAVGAVAVAYTAAVGWGAWHWLIEPLTSAL